MLGPAQAFEEETISRMVLSISQEPASFSHQIVLHPMAPTGCSPCSLHGKCHLAPLPCTALPSPTEQMKASHAHMSTPPRGWVGAGHRGWHGKGVRLRCDVYLQQHSWD